MIKDVHAQKNKGSSIIEMMVAFAVLSLAITGVIIVSFGNQDSALGGELNNKAIYLAKEMMEDAYAQALADFGALDDIVVLASPGELFTKELTVSPGDCLKRADVRVSWWPDSPAPQDISFSSAFTDIEASQVRGGDCQTEETSDWENPGDATSETLSGFPATDIDVVDDMVYLTTAASAEASSDFFIYEFDPDAETLTYRGELNTGEGLYALDVAGDYAFVVNKTKTPPPQPRPVWQLQVIRVSDPLFPAPVQSITLPDSGGDGAYPVGLSLYYYDDVVYVGTEESPDDPELHVFDAGDPETIPLPSEGTVEIGSDVRAIAVDGAYAYLATSDTNGELAVVDVADLDVESGFGFDAPGNHWGSAVTAFSNEIYFGLSRQSNGAYDDFFVLDGEKILEGPQTGDGVLGSADIGLNNNGFITGIVVRISGQKVLAFLGLDDGTAGLEIWNITRPADMELNSACGETNFSENSTGIDMEGDYIFTANSANAKIRVIKDLEALCPLSP